MTRRPRITWRKQPSEGGLRAIGQGPRGAILRVNGEDVGRVYANRLGMDHKWRGWWWIARDNAGAVPLKNTCNEPVADLDIAKAACEAYVRECLAKVPQ